MTGVQLNRMCGSGQQAIHFAAQSIASGDQELVIAAGIEMMSVVPMGADAEKEIFTTGTQFYVLIYYGRQGYVGYVPIQVGAPRIFC